jgi:hypothetical protein
MLCSDVNKIEEMTIPIIVYGNFVVGPTSPPVKNSTPSIHSLIVVPENWY